MELYQILFTLNIVTTPPEELKTKQKRLKKTKAESELHYL